MGDAGTQGTVSNIAHRCCEQRSEDLRSRRWLGKLFANCSARGIVNLAKWSDSF